MKQSVAADLFKQCVAPHTGLGHSENGAAAL